MKKLWSFINSKLFGYLIIIIIAIILVGTCSNNSNLRKEAKITQQNIEASQDTLVQERLKNGELQASIQGYQADSKELELFNKKLADQVKAEKGKVITLNNIVFHLKQDTADLQEYINNLLSFYGDPKKINDSTWNVDWTLAYTYDSSNYDIFKGRTQIGMRGDSSCFRKIDLAHNRTSLLERDSKMSLTWGQKYEDGKVKVFARTSHPAFQAQLLEGVYVDYPKKKHWFTGFGVGPTLNIGYDFMNQKPALILGVGVHYNIYNW